MELVVASKTFRMAVCFINTSVGMSYSLGASSAPRTVWQDFREIERSCCGLRRGLISTRAASRSMGEEPGERRRGSLADVFPGKPILSRLSPTQGTGGIFLARKDLGTRAAAGRRDWAGCVGRAFAGVLWATTMATRARGLARNACFAAWLRIATRNSLRGVRSPLKDSPCLPVLSL